MAPFLEGDTILIEEESYLLQVSRYIHLNPAEAKLCINPIDYSWSSYFSFINATQKYRWLKTDLILSRFENSKSYDDFIAQGIDDHIKKLYRDSPSIFGSKKFIKECLSKTSTNQKKFCSPDIRKTIYTPTFQKIAESVAEYYSVRLDDLKQSKKATLNLPRKIAIFISKRYGQYSHQEISTHFGNVSSNSISTLIQRIEKYILLNPKLQNDLEKIIKANFI